MAEYFTRQEALDKILDYLKDNPNTNTDDVLDKCFNEDYYIVGRPQADEALQQSDWGIWGAIGVIIDYEKDTDGEISTDLRDPERVANMLEYVIGEDVWNEIEDKFKEQTNIDLEDFSWHSLDDQTQDKLINFIKNYDISEEPYDEFLG